MSFDLVGSWFEISEADAAGDPNRLHHAVNMRTFAADVFGPGVGGVTSPAALMVSERGAGANMSVDVAVGGCVIASTRSVHQGSYHGYNSAVINKSITTSDPTNARIDRILARVKDSAQDAAFVGIEGMEVVVETGTPASVPTAPVVTVEDWIELARVMVPASATSITNADITDMRQSAASGGVTLTTTAQRPAAPFTGQVISDTTTGKLHRWSGSEWQDITPGTGTELIQTQTLASTSTSVTFSSIPAGFRDLRITVAARVSGVPGTTGRMRFNGATNAAYASLRTVNTDGTISATSDVGATSFTFGAVPGTDAPSADDFGDYVIDIPNYRLARRPGFVSSAAYRNQSASWRAEQGGGKWGSTASTVVPITSITLFVNSGTFVVGSTFALYGTR